MTNTLSAYAVEALARMNDPLTFGRLENVASIAGDGLSLTSTALAVGTVSSATYQNYWLWRPTTANTPAADRFRMVSAYTSASGTLAHAGTAWVDKTAPGRTVLVMKDEPIGIINAINVALARLRFLDIEILPTVSASTYYPLGQMPWITQPSDIERVLCVQNPVLTRNRFFAKWNVVNQTAADWWTLAGSGATIARSALNARRPGNYTAAITRTGTNVTYTQSIGLLDPGLTPDASLRGRVVTGVLVGFASSASQLRVGINDGVSTQYSSYHTGNSSVQELTTGAITLSSAATKCDLVVEVNGTDGTVYLSEGYACLNQLSNVVRADGPFPTKQIPKTYDQSADGAIQLITDPFPIGQQIVVMAKRNYPALANDNDTSDAPLVTIAVGALARFWEGKKSQVGVDSQFASARWMEWAKKTQTLNAAHYAVPNERRVGLNLPPALLYQMAGRP